ncbi:MAG: hypothetical protein C0616_11900 [Desulfuromonas sp.]|nr:MAG: hypothetical protein C0616_11900 [Desulfuromonas sp.]
MKKVCFIVALTTFCVLLMTQASFAVGFGFFGEYEAGDGDFEFDFSDEFDVDSKVYSLGFSFDTDPVSEKVFSYRLNAGYSNLELEDDESVTLELDGFIVDNTFCFGLVRSPNTKIWLGPQIRVGYYSGDSDDLYYDDIHFGDDIDIELVAFAVAATVGANFKGAGNSSFTMNIGVRVSGFAGEVEYLGYDEDIEGNTTTYFINVGALF